MVIRPTDSNGDILPVLSVSQLVSGPPAVARLAEDRLKLLTGDWWENPKQGCEAFDLMRESRMTDGDLQALASYLSSYVRETPGVLEITESRYSADGRSFHFACTVLTDGGTAEVSADFG